ncbi:MAG: prolipoprotein diacylglyceryl transferase [Alphaproteobacteria bacterium]
MNAIVFPNIDPVAISLGFIDIHWYGIAYVCGILLGWMYARHLVKRYGAGISLQALDDYIVWVAVGIIAGGRLGYVLFYHLDMYLAKPWEIFYVWEGGMAFHGGLIGVITATFLFAFRRGLPVLALGDIISCVTPIGLLFGRVANFVNAELYGRVTDVPWGIIFPGGGPEPRHPSQLYEAFGEGLLLFAILWGVEHFTKIRQQRPGIMIALFLIGYGLARSVAELYRQPDAHIGYLMGGTTMGQLLSTPVVFIGLLLAWHVLSQKRKLNGSS